jgi:hypothetical protein
LPRLALTMILLISPTQEAKITDVNYQHLVGLVFISFIHMCIQCLGLFSSLPPEPTLSPATSLSPLPPHYQAETILPLSLILLKREYMQ